MMHGGLIARGEVKKSSLTAVITRADGTVENLGVIAYYHRNPLMRAAWAVWQFIRGKKP